MKAKKSKPTPKPERPRVQYLLGLGGTAVGVGAFYGVGVYSLESVVERGKINSDVNPNNISLDSPKTTLLFTNTRAVDREIRRLTRLKKHMEKQANRLKKLGIKIPSLAAVKK